MKRKTIALMTTLTFVMSLSACGDKTPVSIEMINITSVEESEEITEEPEQTEEITTLKETEEITISEETEEITILEETEEITISEETEEDIKQKEIEKVQSALGDMPYYGDITNCKMTAEQATAFAQLIADGLAGDFGFRGGKEYITDVVSWSEPFYLSEYDNLIEVNRENVMLGDFAEDGIPYLYVFSSETRIDSYEIYGWTDNTVKLAIDAEGNAREGYYLYEDENEQCKMKLTYEGAWGIAEQFTTYSFANGIIEEIYTRLEEEIDGVWHVTENGTETGVYSHEEYFVMREERYKERQHTHTQPCTCFYDMQPCTLEEMVNYLNAYASVMSDGQSVPVEIKK